MNVPTLESLAAPATNSFGWSLYHFQALVGRRSISGERYAESEQAFRVKVQEILDTEYSGVRTRKITLVAEVK